jgi:serine/threonine-protein kinase OSR1/STK39
MDLEQVTTEIAEISKEVQMMRMCSHVNILRCHASFVNKSSLYLVMPLMEKGSCLHVMHEAKKHGLGEGMAEEWLGYILLEVLHGLEYLHENGHIHRDIKAGNVLLDRSGKVALADFGVSSWLIQAGLRHRSAKTFVGTPCWMAPEVMEQVDGYDYKADIWSFGITALELAKGFAPYAVHPPMKVLLLTIQEEPPSLRSYSTEKSSTGESFSRSFKEMVRMCLQKEARKRPTVHTLLNCKFFRAHWPVTPLVEGLLNLVENISVTDDSSIYQERSLDIPVSGDNLSNHDLNCSTMNEAAPPSCARSEFACHEEHEHHKTSEHHLDGKTAAQSESGEFVRGTTWTFDDGHEVVLKSESYIRREIDAKSAQDDQECKAIFDDLEDLMNQRGGEWDFKKNRHVR